MVCAISATPQYHPDAVDPTQVQSSLLRGGHEIDTWTNPPFYRWPWHAHDVAKTIYCLRGQVTFHTQHGDVALSAGDRLDLPRGVGHAASVGPAGVTCVEVAGDIRSGASP